MSFWSRLAAASRAVTGADALGSVFEAAAAAKNDDDAQSLWGVLKTASGAGLGSALRTGFAGIPAANTAVKGVTATSEDPAGFSLMDAAHFPYDYGVNRPLGTIYGVANRYARGQAASNPLQVWRDSWNASDKVSVGQNYMALQGALLSPEADLLGIGQGNTPFNRDFQVDSAKAQDYFHNTAAGRISSGTLDLAANIFADPLVLGGKAIKAARVAKSTFASNAERDAALDLAAGNLSRDDAAATVGAKTAARADKAAGQINDWLSSTYGKQVSEVMQDPRLRDTGDAATLAYWFHRADETMPDAESALNMKRDLFAVALGNSAAIDRVAARRADVAGEVTRMMSPVEQTSGLAHFRWDDGGQGMIDWFNSPEKLAELEARADSVVEELSRLDSLSALAGSTSRFAPTGLEAAKAQARAASVWDSEISDGLGSRPIRVVRGVIGKSTPGNVNVVQADEGHDALRTVLSRAKLPGAVRAKLMDDFAKAPSREARYQVVQNADQALFHHIGQQYGKSRREINTLMLAAQQRRGAVASALRARLYSAAPDAKFVMHVDEDGMAHAFDRPFLQSQIEDMAPITDPGIIHRVLRHDARTGVLGELANAGTATRDVAEALAVPLTRLWKDAQLFRLAYPMRIQVDSQFRLMAGIGAMQYVLSAGRGTKNLLSRKVEYLDDETGKLLDKHRPSDLMRPETFRGIDVQPARDIEEFRQVERKLTSQNTVNLMLGDENNRINVALRRTGNFDVVRGSDPGWVQAQLRSVNQQIRNSPVASRMLTDMDDASVKRFAKTDPAAVREWNNFKNQFDDIDEWLSVVRSHVNHSLPVPEARLAAAERDLSKADLEKWFDDVTLRPQVHGETASAIVKSPAARMWDNVRTKWYRVASDLPETVMARHPYYNARFRTHMRSAIARLDNLEDDLSAKQVEDIRRLADRKARTDMANTLFDLSHQSRLAHGMRFLSPFFAAWEDVMMKWGHLFYEDPSTAVRFGQAWQSFEKGQLTEKDDQGVEYVILPKFLSPVLPQGAKNLRFRKDSVNIVFQGQPWWLPGFGPAVQVPTNEMVKKFFPDYADVPALKYILPYGVDEDSPQWQLAPAWAKRLRASGVLGNGGDDYAKTYAMLMAQEQIKFRNGQRRSEPSVKEIANATRNWYLMRTLLSFAAPVTASPTPEFQFYMDMAHRYRDEDQQTRQEFADWRAAGAQGEPPPESWEERFYRDFPDYFDMSISLSQNNTGIVASDRAAKAQRKWKEKISANPKFGWAVVGPDNTGDFSQGVYANQMSQALGFGNQTTSRSRKTPRQALEDTQAERGWIEYRKGMTALTVELQARGLHSFSQKSAADLAALKQQFVAELSAENPSWANAYGPGREGQAQEFIRYAEKNLLSDKRMADRPDIQALSVYMQGRRAMQEALAARGVKRLPDAGNLGSPNVDLRQVWDQFTSQLVSENLGFEQMWQRVLETDDLGGDL